MEIKEAFLGKKVLIAGGLGFIGSNLAKKLAALGARVSILDALIPEHGGSMFHAADLPSPADLTVADARDEAKLIPLLEGRDYLFHLAGQTSHLDSMRDPWTDLEMNCRTSLAILEAVRKVRGGTKVVFASTRQLYGIPRSLPVRESHPVVPVDINGVHKMAAEWYHGIYHKVYGIPAAIVRLTNTYGPRMRIKDARQTFLGDWIRRLLKNEEILVFGEGSQLRDFTYVDDASDALLLAACREEATGQIFNLGGERAISLRDLADLLVELNGRGSYRIVPFPDELKAIDIGDFYADYSLIRSRLGWVPSVDLREGLRKTLEYFRAHGEHYL